MMTQRTVTRRQIVQFLGTAAIGSIAGCAGLNQSGQQETETPSPSPRASPPSTTSMRKLTETATTTTHTSEQPTTRATTTEPSVDSPTPETPAETTQPTESPTTQPPTDSTATDTPAEPGYKNYHWHGRLFFEIDGNLVDFSQPIYYLKNLQQKRPETVYFHFHDSSHAPNEWSNEKKTVTFARALDLLPTIKYARRGSSDVITYKGRTYRSARSGTSIDIYRGTTPINPQSYTVQHDDDFWVRVGTNQRSDTTTSGTQSGKLIIDINNRRLAFTSRRDRRAGSSRFGFRRDGNPYTWYSNGQSVTLAEALNTLPDIKYQRGRRDTSVITYTANDAYSGTYRGTSSATTILTRQRWNDVDPQSYELQDGDILWVYIHTSRAPENEH